MKCFKLITLIINKSSHAVGWGGGEKHGIGDFSFSYSPFGITRNLYFLFAFLYNLIFLIQKVQEPPREPPPLKYSESLSSRGHDRFNKENVW